MTRQLKLSLKSKAVLINGAILAALLLGMLIPLSMRLNESVCKLQTATIRQQLERVVIQIDQTAEKLQADVTENALWDETVEFLAGDRPDYLEANFYEITSVINDFDVILVWDLAGQLVGAAHIAEDGLRPGTPAGIDASALILSSRIDPATDQARGLLHTAAGPVLFASSGVHPTDGSGDPLGVLTYVRTLDGTILDQAKRISGVLTLTVEDPVGTAPFDEIAIELPAETIPSATASFPPIESIWQTDAMPPATIRLPASEGAPVGLVATLPSNLLDIAIEGWRQSLVYPILGGGILILSLLLLMEWLVLRPITVLTSEMTRVAESGDTADQLAISGDDEFATLASAANRMLDAIQSNGHALQRERTLVAGILQSSVEGVIALRAAPAAGQDPPTFVIVRTNTAAQRILDRPADSLIGQPLAACFPEILASSLRDRLLAATRSGESVTEEIAGCDARDGHWFQISAAPWEDGLVVTLHATTDRRRAESELRDSLSEIERFNRAMLGREERIIELKAEINALCARHDQPLVYRVDPVQ